MLIRQAEISDIPEILRLLKQVCNVHHAIRPDIFKRDSSKYYDLDLIDILNDEDLPVWCAIEDDKLLGYCFCRVDISFGPASTVRKELYIDDLCVDETARGKVVATCLFAHVRMLAKMNGFQFITLNVWEGNDSAMRFYEKMGMKPRKVFMDLPLEDTKC